MMQTTNGFGLQSETHTRGRSPSLSLLPEKRQKKLKSRSEKRCANEPAAIDRRPRCGNGRVESRLSERASKRAVPREFQQEHPCPSTGRTSRARPGYRKDHILPLAVGGRDAVSNMQSQTILMRRLR